MAIIQSTLLAVTIATGNTYVVLLRKLFGYCSSGDHTETIDIDFDPTLTNYSNLLYLFWINHDPTVCRKRQYMSAIFYHNEEQKTMAENSKVEREKLIGTKVATQILPFEKFYDAESYHQKYILQTYHRPLFKSLKLSKSDLITSTIAARLNGYVGGYGTIEAFNKEYQSFGLSSEYVEYVRRQIMSGRRGAC